MLRRDDGASTPPRTWIDVDVTLEPDTVLEPNVLLRGSTHVATGATVGPNCELTDTLVGAGATVTNTTADGAVIGPEATVGPYTYLRPGTVLGRGAKAGGFVEMKKAELGDGAKVPHLSYVGDATIGAGANIGAGTIFANYDGVAKHHTTVGEHTLRRQRLGAGRPGDDRRRRLRRRRLDHHRRRRARRARGGARQAAQHRRVGRPAPGRHQVRRRRPSEPLAEQRTQQTQQTDQRDDQERSGG